MYDHLRRFQAKLPAFTYFNFEKLEVGQNKTLLVLGIFCVSTVICYQFTLTYILIYPFILVSTIFHEFGHALMCVLTGGSVKGILINPDESGLTRFVGGVSCLVLPAGYLGSTFIGAVMIFTGFSEKASKIMSAVACFILLTTFFFAEKWYTMIIAGALIAGLSSVIWYENGRYVRWFVLLMGSIAALDSIENILNQTVFNYIPQSDAVQFARQCSIFVPFFMFGLIWLVIALGSIGGAVMAGLRCFPTPTYKPRFPLPNC